MGIIKKSYLITSLKFTIVVSLREGNTSKHFNKIRFLKRKLGLPFYGLHVLSRERENPALVAIVLLRFSFKARYRGMYRRERLLAMYSQKLQQFIGTHTPEKVVWDMETIISLAEKAGLEVRPDFYNQERTEVVSWGGLSDCPVRQQISYWQAQFGNFGNPLKGGDDKWWGDHPTEKERFYQKLSFQESMKVTWYHRIDGTKLIFWPYCRYSSGSFGTGMKDPGKALMEVAGLQETVFDLPEQVVTLPREPWRYVDWAQDTYWAQDETETLFVSEVAARVQPFIDQLQKLVAECEAQSA